jgi:hypothetical protein
VARKHLARFYFCRVLRKHGSIHVGTRANAVGATRGLRARSAIGGCAFQRFTQVSRKAEGFLGKPWFLGTLTARPREEEAQIEDLTTRSRRHATRNERAMSADMPDVDLPAIPLALDHLCYICHERPMIKRRASVHLRMPAPLRRQLERAADAGERSLSSQIVLILSTWARGKRHPTKFEEIVARVQDPGTSLLAGSPRKAAR